MQHTCPTLLSWLATYLIHSTLLLGGALLVARAVRGPAVREVLWKGALIGGLVTATLHGTLGAGLGVGRFDLPLIQPAGQATIALQLGAEAPASGALAAPGPRNPAGSPRGAAQSRSAAGSAATQALAPARWPGFIAAGWAFGVLLLLAVFLHERRRMSRLFAARRPVREGAPRKALAQLLAHTRSSRRVRLTTCPGIGSPVALGSSEICLPERAGRDLSMGELEALMAHELAHLERRDSLWLTAIHLLERVLFPQPLNRIVRRRLQSDVEILCDDSAARRLDEPAELARCLARVAGWMESTPTPALATGMAHSPSQLVARVERLLTPRPEPRRGAIALAALSVSLVLTAVGFGGPGVAAPPAPANQDTPAQARLLRVVASMRTVSERTVLNYRLGKFETTELENLGRHLQLLHARYPEARIAIAPHVGAKSLTGLVDVIFERFDAIMVEGEGPEQEALRAQIVHQRPVKVRLEVVKRGRKVDPATRKPWSGEGRYAFDDTRLLEYRLGDRKTRTLEDLREALLLECTRRPKARVRVNAGRGTVYEDVVAALDIIVAAGFTEIGFVGAYPDYAPLVATIEPVEEVLEEVEPENEFPVEPAFEVVEPEEIFEEVGPDFLRDIGPDFTGEVGPEDVLDEEIEEVIEEWMPILEIDSAGHIRTQTGLLFDPLDTEEPWKRLREWLALAADKMDKAPLRGDAGGPLIPNERLLIRAEDSISFRYVQKIMEICGQRGVQIWKIEFAASGARGEQVPLWLPTDTAPEVEGERTPNLELVVRLLDEGTDHTRPEYEYSLGPFKTTRLDELRSALARLRGRRSDLRLVIDPRTGCTAIEILRLVQAVRAEGYSSISFVGAHFPGER